ncbi:MAG: AAA family ATPase, partial [Giesbergeria sp.]
MKPFTKGLVVGKFCPLHQGHEHLISTALDHCDQLWVVSYTQPEFVGLGPAMRHLWLAQRFPQAHLLVLNQGILDRRCQIQSIASHKIPMNNAADDVHRAFVGWLCTALLGTTIDAVFT